MALQVTYWDHKWFFLYHIDHCGIAASPGWLQAQFSYLQIQYNAQVILLVGSSHKPYDAPGSVETVLGIIYRNLLVFPKSLILEWWGSQSELDIQ